MPADINFAIQYGRSARDAFDLHREIACEDFVTAYDSLTSLEAGGMEEIRRSGYLGAFWGVRVYESPGAPIPTLGLGRNYCNPELVATLDEMDRRYYKK